MVCDREPSIRIIMPILVVMLMFLPTAVRIAEPPLSRLVGGAPKALLKALPPPT